MFDAELDWADVFYRMERVFKVPIPREKWKLFDGTFDSLLTMIVAGPIPGLPRAQSMGDKVTSSTTRGVG